MVGVFDLSRQFEQRTVDSVFGAIADAREDFGADGAYVLGANLDQSISKETLIKEVRKTLGMMGLDAGDVRQIKAGIQNAFANILLFVSSVAFAAMGVSSLGVANTVMAGIRTRRWQFGVLRSIGVTRGQLLRLVLAEAALLGVVGCVLGLVAGMEMSFDARLLSSVSLGLVFPLFIPWGYIFIGVGSILLVTALASLWPAISVARQEPLALLQAGRAAA
jgi:putative ABC transport system permease protein